MDIYELNKKYKNTLLPTKRIEILDDEYKLLLPEMDKRKIGKFVQYNFGPLDNFAKFYGLDENGPMEKFITNFYKVNGNLDFFIEKTNALNILNRALAKDCITESQLKDICDEGDRTLIIYNESFWKKIIEQARYPQENDFKWIILSEIDYKDFLNGNKDTICENKRIDKALKRALKEVVGEPDNSEVYIYKCHVTWSYIFFFTTLIHSIFNKEINEDEFVNHVKEGLTDFNLVKSKGFIDLDEIDRAQKDCATEELVERKRFGF